MTALRPHVPTLLLVCLWGCAMGAFAPAQALAAPKPGLSVNADGILIKDGKPYRAIGINYFSAFIRRVRYSDGRSSDTSFREGFKTLSEHKIPYVRLPLCPFYPVEYKLYFQDKPAYFRMMDEVVRSAEENKIGLIVDLFWTNFTVPDLVGEPVDQWGNPQSKTHAFMRQYVKEVVGRYKDSPAIWGWEFGNECHLSADLPNAAEVRPDIAPQLGTPATRSARDEVTHQMLTTAYVEFAKAVREIDPDRMITSGNAAPRPAAWHHSLNRSQEPDTRDQYAEVLLRDNPDPLNVVSVHIYTDGDNAYFADRKVLAGDLIRETQSIAASVKKPLFVGEFCPQPDIIGKPEERPKTEALFRAIEDSGVALAAIWTFDYDGPAEFCNVKEGNRFSYILDMIAQTNARIDRKLNPPGPQGLSVSAEGVLVKDGRPYRGLGVNYFSAFNRMLREPQDVANTTCREGFKVLAEHQVPFARIPMCGFYPVNFRLYQSDREEYFRLMDRVVKAGEENHVGIIASLFWWYPAVPDLVGEPMDQWGNPRSKTHAFMRQYITDVVMRYKDSPAIWGWEFGNEFTLSGDMPNAADLLPWIKPEVGTPTTRGKRDIVTSQMIQTAHAEFAKTVRQLDPYRIISTGNAAPRPCAWHNSHENNFTSDTLAQYAEILLRDNPDPMNVISIHVYSDVDNRTGDSWNDKFFADRKVSLFDMIKECNVIAQKAKKPLFLGEFGSIVDERGGKEDRQRQETIQFFQAIESAGIPLAAIWNFDRDWETEDCNIKDTNEHAYMLDLIRETNQRISHILGGNANLAGMTR